MISGLWILYALSVSALAGTAAVAAESALRSRGLPARWVWLVAATTSVAAPAAAVVSAVPAVRVVDAAAEPAATATGAATSGVRATRTVEPLAGETAPAVLELLRREIDAVALPFWAATTTAVLLLGLIGWFRLRRRRGAWRERRLHGVRVQVSSADGPAAVGVLGGRIVLPAWALGLPRRTTRLIVLHEGEHLRGGDTALLAWSGLLVAAMPWNPFVWWQHRRLGLAVEVDCDRRVVARCGDRRRYAEVLLEMAARGRQVPALSPGLGPGALERRIRAVVEPGPAGWTRLAVGIALAAAAVVAACEAPMPHSPIGPEGLGPAADLVEAAPRLADRTLLRRRLREVAADPDVRDLLGSVVLDLHVDADGRPTEIRRRLIVARSTGGPEMVDHGIEVARAVRLEPAVREGRNVPARTTLWVVFRPAGVEATLVDPVKLARDGGLLDAPEQLRPDLSLIRRLEESR